MNSLMYKNLHNHFHSKLCFRDFITKKEYISSYWWSSKMSLKIVLHNRLKLECVTFAASYFSISKINSEIFFHNVNNNIKISQIIWFKAEKNKSNKCHRMTLNMIERPPSLLFFFCAKLAPTSLFKLWYQNRILKIHHSWSVSGMITNKYETVESRGG